MNCPQKHSDGDVVPIMGRQGNYIVSEGGEERKPFFFLEETMGGHGKMVNLEGPLLLSHSGSPRERNKLLNSSVLTYGGTSILPQCRRLTELTRRWTPPSLHDTMERFFKGRGEK